jgi:hypothetical protein
MSRTVVVLVAVLILSLGKMTYVIASDRVASDGFISKVGTYRIYHGKLTLEIYEEKGKLNYLVGRTNMFSSGPAEPFIEKGPKWFAFVESPRSRSPRAIWFFDGRDLLVQIAYDPNGDPDDYWAATLYHSDSRPSIVTDAPKAVRDRLPASFKKKFRASSPPGQ